MRKFSKIFKLLTIIIVVSGAISIGGFIYMFTSFPHSSGISKSRLGYQMSETKLLKTNYTYKIRCSSYLSSDYSQISINASFTVSDETEIKFSQTLVNDTSKFVKIRIRHDPPPGSDGGGTYYTEETFWAVSLGVSLVIENLTSNKYYTFNITVNSVHSPDDASPSCGFSIQEDPPMWMFTEWMLLVLLVTGVFFIIFFFSLLLLVFYIFWRI
ncbi:MAG: hypothetical protein ACXADY_19545 [Candidatus Hodarchaeales archaeon]|jgi:hypothetical protein